MGKTTTAVVDEARLRELIAEAHGAAKDLRQALTEYRAVIAAGTEELRRQLQETADKELKEWYDGVQENMNRHAADLNTSVLKARNHIVESLTMARFTVAEDGKTIQVSWSGGTFVEDGKVTKS